MKEAILKPPRFRCRTIPLRKRRDRYKTDAVYFVGHDRAPAFSCNPRGQLIHRTRFFEGIIWRGELSHYHVNHLCGNGFNIDPELIREVMFADPPEDRLLCSRCHGVAEGMRLPTSDQLAGRHVHRGILVPTQVCCQEHKSKR